MEYSNLSKKRLLAVLCKSFYSVYNVSQKLQIYDGKQNCSLFRKCPLTVEDDYEVPYVSSMLVGGYASVVTLLI